MTRNLKALGLALVAVFALSAMAASAASAQSGVLTSDGPFVIDGTDKGEPNERALTAFGGKTECTTGHYTGGKVNGTDFEGDHELLANPATAFTLTPEYTGCKSGGGLPETVTMNGCDYEIYNIQTESGGGEPFTATTDLVCPEGKEVTIDIYLSEHAHVTNEVFCSIHVPAQTKLEGAKLTNEGKHITLGGTVKGVKMTNTCAVPPVTTETAELHLNATLWATDAATEGVETGLNVSD